MENRFKKINIIYIDSIGHSGSTILDMLISGNSNMFSVGEFKLNKTKTMNKPCTCGSENIYRCPYWSNVNKKLEDKHSLSLDEVQINSNDRKTFREHNRIIFATVQEVSGKDYIVESSKNIRRCMRLFNEKDLFNVYPIFLKRDLPGVLSSFKKKGEDKKWKLFLNYNLTCANHYKYRNHAIQLVKYDTLVKETEKTLKGLMNKINLELEEKQLQWDPEKRHNIGGNRTRRIKNNPIKLDESWKTNLRLYEKILSFVFGFPGNLIFNFAAKEKT